MSGRGPNVGASSVPVNAPHSNKCLAEKISIRELVKYRIPARPWLSQKCFTYCSAQESCTASAGRKQNGSVQLEVHAQFNYLHLLTTTPIRERSSDPAVEH